MAGHGAGTSENMITRGLAWLFATGYPPMNRAEMAKFIQHLLTPTVGKPVSYSPEVAAEVLRRLADGETLSDICDSEGMPHRHTFLDWVTVGGLGSIYAHARLMSADVRFDRLRRLAASATSENAQAVRLMVDTEKWVVAKLNPAKYGDKLDLHVTGQLNISALPDDQLNARVEARLRAKLEPIFERIEHPTLDDILEPFRITALPASSLIADQSGDDRG